MVPKPPLVVATPGPVTNSMRVAITGASGLVGSRVTELLAPSLEFIPLTRPNVDLATATPDTLARTGIRPDAVLHLAALTAVDELERERPHGKTGPGYRTNVNGTRAIAEWAATLHVPMLLVSTDFVFPVNSRGPFPEEPSPTKGPTEVSWYGWTKVQAETIALENVDNAVLRISYPFQGKPGPRMDHARRLLKLAKEKRLYPLFTDQTFTPSFLDDVALSIRTILTARNAGIFHVAVSQPTTPYEFGKKILTNAGVAEQPLAGRMTSADKSRAPRPQHGGLATRVSAKQGMRIRGLDEVLADFETQRRAA